MIQWLRTASAARAASSLAEETKQRVSKRERSDSSARDVTRMRVAASGRRVSPGKRRAPFSQSTASWPSTSLLVVAKAETRCRGALSSPRSWLRRQVLPSMAIRSGRSGQASRTQAVKTAENNAGLTRFMSKVSQRPVGTPCA